MLYKTKLQKNTQRRKFHVTIEPESGQTLKALIDRGKLVFKLPNNTYVSSKFLLFSGKGLEDYNNFAINNIFRDALAITKWPELWNSNEIVFSSEF